MSLAVMLLKVARYIKLLLLSSFILCVSLEQVDFDLILCRQLG
jgi:hypothetical protein